MEFIMTLHQSKRVTTLGLRKLFWRNRWFTNALYLFSCGWWNEVGKLYQLGICLIKSPDVSKKYENLKHCMRQICLLILAEKNIKGVSMILLLILSSYILVNPYLGNTVAIRIDRELVTSTLTMLISSIRSTMNRFRVFWAEMAKNWI